MNDVIPSPPENHAASNCTLDWKRAHTALVELARRRADLDAEIGRWLLYAARAAAPAWLGYGSIREYAHHLFGFTARQTQERLRVAEALEELPATHKALEQGVLCWSAVRELTRVVTPATEAEWLAVARRRNAHEVEQMVRGHDRGDRPSDPVSRQALDKVLRFELSPEVYATVQEALAKVRRDAGGRLDDEQALLLMARQVLGGPTDEGRSSYQLAVSVCPSCQRGFQHARGELVELHPEAVDMARCDAQHIGDVHGANVRPEAAGSSGCAGDHPADSDTHAGKDAATGKGMATQTKSRAAQSIPPRIRRLVLRRAGGHCEVPSCKNSLFLDVHHRTLRSEGGGHEPTELLVLCGAHHKATHEGRLILEGDARSGWKVRHADGTLYGGTPSPQEVEVSVKVFHGLRSLGFKEGACRRALEQVRRRIRTHVSAEITAERMLREALRVLSSKERRA
jgi:hypothetical protein